MALRSAVCDSWSVLALLEVTQREDQRRVSRIAYSWTVALLLAGMPTLDHDAAWVHRDCVVLR
jgi:hypothetical protein